MVIVPEKEKRYSPGELIAGYRVVSFIGNGSYGCLYLVKDISGAFYALKILKNNADREFSALSKIRELPDIPGIAKLHGAGRLDDGRIYYLMDAADNLSEGGTYLPDTLANRLARRGRLPGTDVLDLASALLPALQQLHAHGVAHFDIKPENIVFIRSVPVLADIGSLDYCHENSDVPACTPEFYPPEEFGGTVNGHFSEKNDLYALGMTLYCAWSGCGPEDFPLLPDNTNPGEIRTIRKLLLKACNPEPAYRFQNTEEFFRAAVRAQKAGSLSALHKRKILLLVSVSVFCIICCVYLSWKIEAQRQQKEWQKRWDLVESRVALAQMAERAEILPQLKFVKTEFSGKLPGIDDSIAQFQLMHDMLREYMKWEKTAGTERKAQAGKLVSMAERCPAAYRDPVVALHGFFLTLRELSPEEDKLIKILDTVCGREYRQLRLEISSVQNSTNMKNADKEFLLRKKKDCLQQLTRRYAREIDCIDTCEMLRSAYEIRRIIFLRKKLEILESELRNTYFSETEKICQKTMAASCPLKVIEYLPRGVFWCCRSGQYFQTTGHDSFKIIFKSLPPLTYEIDSIAGI